jgi:hypothetical protein
MRPAASKLMSAPLAFLPWLKLLAKSVAEYRLANAGAERFRTNAFAGEARAASNDVALPIRSRTLEEV